MHKLTILSTIFLISFKINIFAQAVLPNISVKNLNGQIIISWQNNYSKPISNLSIQRSYDSLKNYTTIGSVLNPQNKENGYADTKPPYNKMYYRVFVSFEGGSYLFSKIFKPSKNEFIQDTAISNINESLINILPTEAPEIITYPSRRIYTFKDNVVVINLPDALEKKYTIKFFDEKNNLVFELNKIQDNILFIEKENFKHIGWYFFEISENGKIIEKNKFLIPKDGK